MRETASDPGADRPRRRRDLLEGAFGSTRIVFDTETSRVHSLEGCGSFVWSLLDGHRTVSEIVGCLRKAYDVDEPRGAADVARFLEDLGRRDLLVEDDRER